MSLISGFPKALLSLLGAQNFGENPKELGALIVPIIDTFELFSLSKQEGLNVVPVAAGGSVIGFTVPIGEVWKVVNHSVFTATGGAVTVAEVVPTMIVDASVQSIGSGKALAINQQRYVTMGIPPFFLNAGSSLGAYYSEIVGVPTCVMTALIQRFRA